jgi:hypothetical protein
MVLTGQQIRAARAILRWKAIELAEKAAVGLSTVQRAEAVDGPAPMMRANMDVIRRALEAGGVEFIPEDGGGIGVRLRVPGGAPAAPQAPPAPPAAKPATIRPVAPIAVQTPESADELLARLRAACAGGKLSAWSRDHGIQKSIVSEVLSGRRNIPASVAQALGVSGGMTYTATSIGADKPASGPGKVKG